MRLEPQGEEAMYHALAQVCQLLIAPHLKRGKSVPPLKEFIPDFWAEPDRAKAGASTLKAKARLLAQMEGPRDLPADVRKQPRHLLPAERNGDAVAEWQDYMGRA